MLVLIDTCKVNKYMREVILHCRDEYGWSDDDAKIYLPRWQKPDKENITELTKPKNPGPWVYQSSVKLANAPYMATMSTYKGGGYVYMFERNVDRTKQKLSELKNQIWMDAHTRAIFLEFTVYNPNINLFGSMIMVIEFLHSGGAIPRLECKVCFSHSSDEFIKTAQYFYFFIVRIIYSFLTFTSTGV